MLFWLLFLFGTTVQATSRISRPNAQVVNFAKPLVGRKLNGSVIEEIEGDNEVTCQFKCVKDERCHSYNFGTLTKSEGSFSLCQLSGSDRFAGLLNFTEDENFKYCGLQSVCEKDSSTCGDKGVCIPNYQEGSVRCNCRDGYTGKPCKPNSCAQLLQDGFTSSGVYTINPDGGKPMKVFCDMTSDGGGWTVFQKRFDGSIDFYLGWEFYKNGFGNLNGEFWLGNDNLHRLTSAYNVTLRVDLEDFDGDIRYAEYTKFHVSDEGDKYRLSIGGYSGTAGNSMTSEDSYWKADGMQFTTRDQDNDLASGGSCAYWYKGAWWYNACFSSNLNGLYLGGQHSQTGIGVNWGAFRGYKYSLKRTEMKVKPNP